MLRLVQIPTLSQFFVANMEKLRSIVEAKPKVLYYYIDICILNVDCNMVLFSKYYFVKKYLTSERLRCLHVKMPKYEIKTCQ